MAEKIGKESEVLKARKGAEAARAEADVAKAEADVAKAKADVAKAKADVLTLKIRKGAEAAKAEADVARAAVAVKRQLFDSCKDFVKTYGGAATKEEILELFPMYADVIDMVLRLQHRSSA
jgi:hypothetical protein